MTSNADDTLADSPLGRGKPDGRAVEDGWRTPAQLTRITSTIALRREQSERTRAVLAIGAFLSLLTLIVLHLPGVATPGPAQGPATVGLVGITVFSAAMLVVYRPPRLMSDAALIGFGVIATFAILAVEYHVGIFTPAVMAAFVTLYYFSLGDSTRTAWAMFVALELGYAVIAALYVLDIGGTRASVFLLDRPKPIAMIALTVVVEAYLALTFWLGRISRRATLDAMVRLESAKQRIHQGVALLNEARADFDRQADALKLGRLSGREVGPYRAEEVVGRGAMGEVYRAVHRESGKESAVKLLHPFVAAQSDHVERFFREVKITSELDSPHIVRVTESGVLEDGSPWLAMDLLKGRLLAEILRDEQRLSMNDAVDLVAQVARGLAVARKAGVVHRDLKPQNLFLSEGEAGRRWMILDFGISAIEGAGGTLTRGAPIGTPSYMAPEQTRGQTLDHRADVFALGAIAYRVLTGRPAFTGADEMHTMYNVAHVMPVQPGSLLPVGEDVESVLALALAKRKEDRFESATALAMALGDAARSDLAPAYRRDAQRVLAALPWGAESSSQPTRH